MAIRLFVEPTLAIRAVATTNSLRIVAPQFRAATALVTRPSYSAITSYALYQADLSYQRLVGLAAYLRLETSDIVLDPDSKNRYFRDLEYVYPLDAHAIGLTKALTSDPFGLLESASLTAGLVKNDDFGMADEVSVLLTYLREFADLATVLDSPVIAIAKSEIDALITSDEITDKVFGKGFADSSLLIDAPSIGFEHSRHESISVADVYAATVSYVRDFPEVITALSDIRPVLDVGLGPTDEVTALEALLFDLSSLASDELTVADASSIDYSRPEADGVSTSDAFDRVVVFSRAFSDAFALDDNATVGGVIKETQAFKTNVFGFTDAQEFSFAKELNDELVLADITSRANEKTLDDNLSIIESLIISKSSAASSVLNAAAFNIAPLNN